MRFGIILNLIWIKRKTTKDLTPICERCENWCGKEHDYSECLNQPCFKLWLSNEYYEWGESFRYE